MMELMVVDDEEGVRRSIKRALEKENYRILLAENGEKAIDILKDKNGEVDIVVSDLKMPGMDGIETLKLVDRINPGTTRIILTGYATMESAILATNEGIDGFLIKPFDNMELRAKVREFFLKKRLKEFVSPFILSELQSRPESVLPRKINATILFTDIRGFSRMVEESEPTELGIFLNLNYYNPISEIIQRYGGTLDKHIGDSIMVIFGAPLSLEDDAYHAMQSALEIRTKFQKINDTGTLRFKIPLGIGISKGEVVVGIFGSSQKKEYTAFGLPVVVAARLEKIAKDGEILLCENTLKAIENKIKVKRTNEYKIKGIQRSIPIYNLLGLS